VSLQLHISFLEEIPMGRSASQATTEVFSLNATEAVENRGGLEHHVKENEELLDSEVSSYGWATLKSRPSATSATLIIVLFISGQPVSNDLRALRVPLRQSVRHTGSSGPWRTPDLRDCVQPSWATEGEPINALLTAASCSFDTPYNEITAAAMNGQRGFTTWEHRSTRMRARERNQHKKLAGVGHLRQPRKAILVLFCEEVR
jgi:hypothetical protein